MAETSNLKDTFNSLKTMVVGTKTSKIDDELDAAIRDISLYRSQSASTSYIDIVKKLVNTSNLSTLFDNMTANDSPIMFSQESRFSRYKSYEAIVSHISYCKSALQVITDNILSPDDITKTVLDINMVDSFGGDDELKESLTADLNNLIKKVKLEKMLDMIIKSTLRLGDFFVEIAGDKDVLLSTSTILTEALDITDYDSISEENLIQSPYDKFEVTLNEGTNLDEAETLTVILDASSYVNEKSDKIKNVKLLCYDPNRVVKLQSSLYPICFGYLVFPTSMASPQEAIKDQAINTICVNILNSLKSKVSNFDVEEINKKDLEDMITKLISRGTTNASNNALRVRYVSEDSMQHFLIPSAKTYPYGESLLDSCEFNAKVYIMLETALAISRLNRSIEKRKINVEIGMPRDAKKAVDAVKNEFNRRKISIDGFGSVDSIPSMVSSFEDVYIPQKDGKPYVDVNTFADAGSDSRGKVEELKFIRDSIVSAMGVPSSYINIEENLSNKAALAEENLMFARGIVNYQKLFSDPLNDLIHKILRKTMPTKADDIMNKIIVSFPTPKSLQFEREAKYTSDLVNLVQSLSTIGVPLEYSREKYLNNIDWKEVEKFKQEFKINKNLNVGLDNQNNAYTSVMSAGMVDPMMGGGYGGGYGGGGEVM